MKYSEATGRTIQASFEEFHRGHPQVYDKFKEYARMVWRANHRKYSSKQILGRVRWHFQFESKDPSGFKINDAYTSRYARLFVEDFPHMKDFFHFRELRSE